MKVPANYCKGHDPLKIRLTKKGSTPRDVALPLDVGQVDGLRFALGDRLLVFGRATWAVSDMVLYDLSSARIIDHFWCYYPILSPSKRLLIYQKFYPQHFTPGVSAEYLLYDLRKSPSDNRPPGIRPSDLEDVGLPLYPPGSQNRPADNTGIPDSKAHSQFSESFYWSKDSSHVAFADGTQDGVALVMIDLSSGMHGIKLSTQQMPIAAIANLNANPYVCQGLPENWFRVTDITFDAKDPTRLTVTFSTPRPACLSVTKMQFLARNEIALSP